MDAARAAAEAALRNVEAEEGFYPALAQGLGGMDLTQGDAELLRWIENFQSGANGGQNVESAELLEFMGMPAIPDGQAAAERPYGGPYADMPHPMAASGSAPFDDRPEKHYLTIAHNGTILEATKTVTGFQPDVILMTSAFETVFEEDIPGLLCIKSHFWDKGCPDVEAFIRRRSIDGDWMWLTTKVIGYVNEPIPATVLEETVVYDEDLAVRINRIIRITAVLVQAVEAAWVTHSQPVDVGDSARSDGETKEDVSAEQPNSFDPFSLMETVRQGIQLDLGTTELFPSEIRLASLVLSGKLPVDQVSPLVVYALREGVSVEDAIKAVLITSNLSMQGEMSPPHVSLENPPPPISVICLSYTFMGNSGLELLSDILDKQGSLLKSIDVSFCGIDEKGFSSFARALNRRKKKGIPSLRGIFLSGNVISTKAAADIGAALSPNEKQSSTKRRAKRSRNASDRTGYDSDSPEDSDEDDEEEGFSFVRKRSKNGSVSKKQKSVKCCSRDKGLVVFHVANTSLTDKALEQLLRGLGKHCPVQELNISSNSFGSAGAGVLVHFFDDGKQRSREHVPMPFLDRIDVSNCNLGDEGTLQLTRAISKRTEVHLIDLKLSSNSIGSSGTETLMNKLLQHELVSLSLDKNAIGDQGCQLVAASLQTIRSLSRLNLSFNQIGSRGISSLMRSLVGCDSITYLGLSGNNLKVSGAIALAFTLAQHPRLEELDLDNCCLGKAAQCHIAAGIISNRWVPMKRLRGFAVGPPLVEIGALKKFAASLSNEECFRIRKDEQMKTLLQWMETNRKRVGDGRQNVSQEQDTEAGQDASQLRFLTSDVVESINDIDGTPSQNFYDRLLAFLEKIPFDEEELQTLQKYFYDSDGGDGDRGSDGYINLKLRGDLLAALDSEDAEEIRDDIPGPPLKLGGSVGIDLDKLVNQSDWNAWDAFKGLICDNPPLDTTYTENDEVVPQIDQTLLSIAEKPVIDSEPPPVLHTSESGTSTSLRERKSPKVKQRITMFPQFEELLARLKANATEMIEEEEDPNQHEVILTQYAQVSLTVLRQLRYHCMNSGLDGWRQAGLKRKILVVDDALVTRKLVAQAFRRAGFIVDTASNGAEGVEKLKASIYDIAFMDIQMPVMNGFEATKLLREWEDAVRPGARQPICALTAAYVDDVEKSELMKFKEAGLDVMESKPCNIPRLFKVVDDVSPMFSNLNITVNQRDRIELTH